MSNAPEPTVVVVRKVSISSSDIPSSWLGFTMEKMCICSRLKKMVQGLDSFKVTVRSSVFSMVSMLAREYRKPV